MVDFMRADERVRSAERLYNEKLKGALEPQHTGEVVAIHVDSGEYFLGRDALESCEKGRARYPGAVFVCMRVGDGPLYRVGAF
jgi:hypothetical protein